MSDTFVFTHNLGAGEFIIDMLTRFGEDQISVAQYAIIAITNITTRYLSLLWLSSYHHQHDCHLHHHHHDNHHHHINQHNHIKPTWTVFNHFVSNYKSYAIRNPHTYDAYSRTSLQIRSRLGTLQVCPLIVKMLRIHGKRYDIIMMMMMNRCW